MALLHKPIGRLHRRRHAQPGHDNAQPAAREPRRRQCGHGAEGGGGGGEEPDGVEFGDEGTGERGADGGGGGEQRECVREFSGGCVG